MNARLVTSGSRRKAQEVSCGALCYGREAPWGIMHYSTQQSNSALGNLQSSQAKQDGVCISREDLWMHAARDRRPLCLYCTYQAMAKRIPLVHDGTVVKPSVKIPWTYNQSSSSFLDKQHLSHPRYNFCCNNTDVLVVTLFLSCSFCQQQCTYSHEPQYHPYSFTQIHSQLPLCSICSLQTAINQIELSPALLPTMEIPPTPPSSSEEPQRDLLAFKHRGIALQMQSSSPSLTPLSCPSLCP